MNKYRIFLTLLLICCMLSGCSLSDFYGSDLYGISKKLGIDLTDADILENIETHGGFHNDGNTYYKLAISDSKSLMKDLEQNSNWSPLPLTEHLQAVVYGGTVDVTEQGNEMPKDMLPNNSGSFLSDTADTSYDIAPFVTDSKGSCLFPDIEHGYYFFYNEQGEEPDAELNFVESYSYNFIVAILDSDNNILYYYEFDS